MTIAVEKCSWASYPDVMYPRRAAISEYLPAGKPLNANAPSSPVTRDFVSLWSFTSAIVTSACDTGAPVMEFTTFPAMR